VVLVKNLDGGEVSDCGKLRGEATNLKPLLVEKNAELRFVHGKKKERTG
jgi:hypothetical protein